MKNTGRRIITVTKFAPPMVLRPTKCGNFLLRFITEAKVDIRFHRKTQAIDDLCRRYLIDQISRSYLQGKPALTLHYSTQKYPFA